MHCSVVSSSWITELSYQKRDIAARVNRELGETVVKDIILRLGAVAPPSLPSRKPRPVREVNSSELAEIERTTSVIKDAELREAVKKAMIKSRGEEE